MCNVSDPFGLCPFTNAPEASCFQLLANWAAATGHSSVLNASAAVQAGGEMLVAAGHALGLAGEEDCGPHVVCGVAFPGISGELGPTPSIGSIKEALGEVHAQVGKLPKGEPGKFGSPQRGTSQRGYRLDPGHPNRPSGDPESDWHINWWDWTEGKRGSGGSSGTVPIKPE